LRVADGVLQECDTERLLDAANLWQNRLSS
jgi:hypothetical protein